MVTKEKVPNEIMNLVIWPLLGKLGFEIGDLKEVKIPDGKQIPALFVENQAKVLIAILEVQKDQNFRQLAEKQIWAILPIDEFEKSIKYALFTDGVAFLFYSYEDNNFVSALPSKEELLIPLKKAKSEELLIKRGLSKGLDEFYLYRVH